MNELVTVLLLMIYVGGAALIFWLGEHAINAVHRYRTRARIAARAEIKRRADELVAQADAQRRHPAGKHRQVSYDREPSLEDALNRILGRTAPRP